MVLGGDESTPVLTQMEGRIDSLECQLEQAIERDRENRRIIAALTQRIPAIEAPESPTEATEQPGRVEPQPQVEGAQEGAERRSWWSRRFGGA